MKVVLNRAIIEIINEIIPETRDLKSVSHSSEYLTYDKGFNHAVMEMKDNLDRFIESIKEIGGKD